MNIAIIPARGGSKRIPRKNIKLFHGIAKHALTYIDIVHADLTINATVLSENIASVKLFTRANYKQLTAEQFQRTPIL